MILSILSMLSIIRLPLTSVAAQKAYNAINSKSGLMIQQLPHHCQQQQQQHHQSMAHSSEDKPQSHVHRNAVNANDLFVETTDGSPANGPAIPSDMTSSTSSLSSSLSSSLASQTNSNNCEIKATIMTDNTTDNKLAINCNSFGNIVTKSENRDSSLSYSTIKNNGNNNNDDIKSSDNNMNNSSVVINNNNNLTDWHKAKRRPVVANNEIEQELALQVNTHNTDATDNAHNAHSKSIDSEESTTNLKSCQNQSIDCQKASDDSKQVNACKSRIESNLTEQKSDESGAKDNGSDINLIKRELNEHKVETNRLGFEPNLMNENNTKHDRKDCDTSSDNYSIGKSVAEVKKAKGNLKNQLTGKDKDQTNEFNGHPLISRRVSFDPLALLLDAALEGELELVKKTAKEVSVDPLTHG